MDRKRKLVVRLIIVALMMTMTTSVTVMPVLAAPDRISEQSVISEAHSWLGVPYKWGGESKTGVDCSGLVRQVYMRASEGQAYYYDRTAEGIRKASYPVWPPRPGDVVIFVDKNSGKCTHVGIYLSASSNGYWDSYFIHAGMTPKKVVKDRLYYSSYYGTGWWYRNFDIYFVRYNPDKYKTKDLSADLNCDNKVNVYDFSILMSYWGTNGSGATSCRSPDINQDGIVDIIDYSIMMSQWTG